jgi:hypothetical protein
MELIIQKRPRTINLAVRCCGPYDPAAEFTQFDAAKSRGGYTRPPRASPVARMRPIPGTDRFELFFAEHQGPPPRAATKGRWTTFGNIGRLNLMIECAHEIVENDPMFRIPRSIIGSLVRTFETCHIRLPFLRGAGGG